MIGKLCNFGLEQHGLAHESPRQVGAHLVRSLFEHGDLLAVDEAGDIHL
jgi:hypothetical protein